MKKPLVIAALLVALGATIVYYRPARLLAVVTAGKSHGCPYARAIRVQEEQRLKTAVKDRILAASKLIESDPAGYELWDTPKGRYWTPATSEKNRYVLPFNLAEQDRGIYVLGDVRVKPGDVVLDCGANVGTYTREALNTGAGIVVAIEPATHNIECLRRNFAAEIAAGRVIVYPKGVWDKDDWLVLHVDDENTAADSVVIRREQSHETEKVPLTTIDKLVAELKLDRVDFIKMDIEGAEVEAVRGGRATIARFRPRMALSVYHEPDDPVEVPNAVREAWTSYRVECGTCLEAGWHVRPEVLFFH
jgi:FkbM family methyltransferase